MAGIVKIRRKADGVIKDVDSDAASEILKSSNYELAEAPQAVDSGSDVEDIARGGVQGLTVGFGDEIGGAIGATKDVVFGDKKYSDWYDQYRTHQKAEEAANTASAERSPWLYGAGDIAGSVGAGILSGGAGLAAGTLKGGVKTGLGKLIGHGAAAGAVEGLGRSHETVEQPLELGKDAATSAAVGGALSGAFGLMKRFGSNASKFIGDKLDDSTTAKQVKTAFNEGKLGNTINQGEKSTRRLTQEGLDLIDDHTHRILENDKNLGNAMNVARNKATQDGFVLKLADIADDAGNGFSSSVKNLEDDVAMIMEAIDDKRIPLNRGEAPVVLQQLKSLVDGTLTPDEAFKLKQTIYKKIFEKEPLAIFKDQASNIGIHIKNAMKEVPGYADAENIWRKYREATIENIIDGDTPSSLRERVFSDVSNQKEKLGKAMDRFLSNIRMPGAAQNKTGKRGLEQMQAALFQLESEHPGLFPKGYVEKTIQSFKNSGDRFAIFGHTHGYEPQTGLKGVITGEGMGMGSPTWTGKGLQVANKAGGGLKAIKNAVGEVPEGVSKTVSPIARLTKEIYSAPEESLREVSDMLKGSGSDALSRLGDALERGLNDKNTSMTNAALFSLMQNPTARKMFRGEEE